MPSRLVSPLLEALLWPASPATVDGPALRAWRRARGLSQRQLAEVLGLRRETITAWERRGPPHPRLVALALRAVHHDLPPLARGRADRWP
jgi:DNA-binding XRE family transcriptional regulator